MSEWGVVGVIFSLLAGLATIVGLFFKPMVELKVAITSLTEQLKTILESDTRRDLRIDKHEVLLGEHGKLLHEHHVDIEALKRTRFIKDKSDH